MSSKISQEIFRQSLNFMNIDNFALKNKNQKYLVRSLYFDNNDYSNFFEKVDGIKIRKKFRLRSYDKNLNSKSPVFFEMKGRAHDRIIKKRIMIDKTDLKYFENLKNLNELSNKYNNDHNFWLNIFSFNIVNKIFY